MVCYRLLGRLQSLLAIKIFGIGNGIKFVQTSLDMAGNINIPIGAITFNRGSNDGTAGIAATDSGAIYGEHDLGTETSRLVIQVGDNINDAIVFRQDMSSGAGAPVDVMTIASGNVGIGTTNPREGMEVFRGHFFHLGGDLIHGFNTYYGGSPVVHRFGGYAGTQYAGLIRFNPTEGSFTFENSTAAGAVDSAVILQKNLKITSAGNIGIGTTVPTNRFYVDAPVSTTVDAASAASRIGTGNVGLYTGVMNASPYPVWMQSYDEAYSVNRAMALNPNGGNVGMGTQDLHFFL